MEQMTGRELRYLADNYEQAQRLRIGVGERIRAVLQGRDQTFVAVAPVQEFIQLEPEDLEDKDLAKAAKKRNSEKVERFMKKIAKGKTLGPVPMLARSYKRYSEEEDLTFDMMEAALELHPAWYWLRGVRAMGATLGCKILARLDVTIAEHVSSFWKHAGLATAPGKLYRCTTCGLEVSYPLHYKIKGPHQKLGSTAKCKGSLEYVHSDTRVAEPVTVPRDDEDPETDTKPKRAYDAYLKKTLWVMAGGFLRAGSKSPYEQHYRAERAKVDANHPAWRDGKRHYWALRKMEKLLLSHLWQTWREAVDLPVGEPYAFGVLGHEHKLDPWDFTDSPRPKAVRRE